MTDLKAVLVLFLVAAFGLVVWTVVSNPAARVLTSFFSAFVPPVFGVNWHNLLQGSGEVHGWETIAFFAALFWGAVASVIGAVSGFFLRRFGER